MALDFYICFYHDKRTFRSAKKAYTELRKINSHNDDTREAGAEQFRVFFCDRTGGYHHTSITQSQMDRRRVKKEEGNGRNNHEKFESQSRRFRKNPNKIPKRSRKTSNEDRLRG